MPDILAEICMAKREHIAKCKVETPISALEERTQEARKPRGLQNALKQKVAAHEVGLIAEIKKASPSKGIIREDFDPEAIARAYEEAGATCLSILTDTPYFQGKNDYLSLVSITSTLPILRKDFMLDPYQIIEARAIGADCILLIMAALEDTQAKELEAAAQNYGMDILIEVHDQQETERALTNLSSKLIGINNRNLKTLNIDLATSKELRTLIPKNYTVVCESGIASHSDIERMRAHDMHCFLVGESLMLQKDIAHATRILLGAA